ncbi:MAG TPA: hypothetical protein VG318_09945 [Actinomycetota bacterium]|nr:hypothetical protein [Actinomycetota bacterium]
MDARAPLRIFFVCTGNQARSPVAAAWTARALAQLPVVLGSAGTMPGRSAPVLADAAAVAAEMGLDLSGHASSHVSAYDLSVADLVVGFELQHVAAAVVDGAAPAERTFLLKEIIRLAREAAPVAAADPLDRARAVIRGAGELRRGRGGFVPGQEIKDPAGRRLPEVRAILNEVVDACDEAFRLLLGR